MRGGRTSCVPGPEFLIKLPSLAFATKSAASSQSPARSRKLGNPGILTVQRLGVRQVLFELLVQIFAYTNVLKHPLKFRGILKTTSLLK